MLSGKRSPSPELYGNILKLCKAEGIKIPDGKKPLPEHFEAGKGYIHPLFEFAAQNKMTVIEARVMFREWILSLYGTEYINLSGENARKIADDWNRQRMEEIRERERAAITNLKLKFDNLRPF